MKNILRYFTSFINSYRVKILFAIGILVEFPSFYANANSLESNNEFEGVLLYLANEYHSDAVKKYSFGNAYNGTRYVKVILKGNVMQIVDIDMHIHQFVDLNNQKAVIYSDITKEGVDCGISYMSILRGQLQPNSKYVKTNFKQEGEINYKGDLCQIMKSTLYSATPGIKTNGNVEIWYSDNLKTDEVYNFYPLGAVVPGIIKKWLYSSNTSSPVGELRSVFSAELIAIDGHDVDDEEINIPTDIVMLKGDVVKIVPEFYKNNTKQMRKLKILPKDDDGGAKLKIEEEWDSVKQWEQEIGEAGKAQSMFGLGFWAKVGLNLISETTKVMESLQSQTQEETESGDEMAQGQSTNRDTSKSNAKKVNHSNWHSLENAYSNYESQLIKMKSDGGYDKQEVKNIQRKMKDTRAKIKEQSGHDRAISPLENWNP